MKLKGSTITLVGGAGLIGSHILDQLLQTEVAEVRVFDNMRRGTLKNIEHNLEDPRVKLLEGDMLDKVRLQSVIDGSDGVYLLAALWLLECREHPEDGLKVNIEGNFNVLEACRRADVGRLIFSSSASVYGDALIEPMPETHVLNNRTFYGATKVAMEQMLRSFKEMYNLNYVALRYFNVYGPRQDYKNAYVSVIMKVLDRIDSGKAPLILGSGEQSYDFVYVKDIARANICAMLSDVEDEVFNVATGKKTSINQLVEMLLDITNSDLTPEYQSANEVFVTDRVGDPARALEKINFVPEVDLRAGLEELVRWRSEQIRMEI